MDCRRVAWHGGGTSQNERPTDFSIPTRYFRIWVVQVLTHLMEVGNGETTDFWQLPSEVKSVCCYTTYKIQR
ncbi:hypothetical protein M404DRAFT_580285 [Pisolithus tinctorius Marx 270]|uniref:Uncharacterized protein n=1 Tax=Pisolithus tinctorius Marx 270 TaxID=870435 RepID=A0A0C3PHG3_PISTI|nr:hypothetical protein M404DRAFT_580285 [Pisolithus tinctorius Marx 270]